ncbi:pentapeptide repeat-containing protein [Capnocytophaga sputigena]|uniref:pentapeptide repeat-containing protein n=1 Tax=Capnocytophaga sputigena TaxID=1019 RepID=UPI0028D52120|nr:pentapeptide repeat-containing protein [Capnocytophaga sputigena]
MKNKYFNTFIRKITDKETKESKICISNFPQDIIFELINYIRNYWNGGYSGYVYIREKINIKNRVMIHEISLSYCIFEKDFAIENSKIREMSLNKSIFDQKVSFSKSIFKYDVLEEENHSKQPFESGSFLETKFKGIVDFSNTSLYGVKFENVDFIGEGKNIYFQNSSLYDIKFKNVNFNFSTHFNNSEIEKLYFEGTTFIGNTNFREISFNGETKFLNCTFTSLQNDTSEEVSFSGSTFKQKVEFSGSKFQIKTSFSYFEKKDELRLEATNFKDKVDFKDCGFTKEADFSETIFEGDTNFSNCTFRQSNIEEKSISSIDFSNAKFNQKVKFSFSTFNSEVIFKNTKFKDLLYFHKVDFYQPTQFHFKDFTKKAFFSNTHFFEEIQFLYCEVESSSFIRFESSIFEKCLEISRSNFDYCKLRFWDIQIKGEDKINEYTNYEKDFGETLIEPSVYSKIRESFRFIKSTFYAENNKIEGLRFYEKEMSVYLEEKRAEDKKSKQSKDKEELMTLNSNLTTTTSNKKGLNNIRKEYVNTYNFLSLIELFFLMICIIPLFLIVNSFLFILPIFYIPIVICTKKCRNMNLKRYMLDKTSVLIKKVSLYIEIVVRICFYRLQSLKNKSDFLFMLVFLLVTLASGIIYIIEHKYIWYWLTLFLFALWVYLEFYQNRRNIKYTIRSNNYISLVLLCIPMMLIFIMLYGVNDYENDLIYKILSFIFSQFSMMFKGDEIFKFFLITILIFIAIIFSIISKKQDKLLLWFNKNSNIFDTDWVVGINFTILVTLIAYIVILSLNPNLFFLPNSEGVGNFLRGLVDVLNITDWRYIKILGKTPSNWQYVFLFIGRIFVAYGIYQTVQAFRKFGKS